jgi:hypothetical protein
MPSDPLQGGPRNLVILFDDHRISTALPHQELVRLTQAKRLQCTRLQNVAMFRFSITFSFPLVLYPNGSDLISARTAASSLVIVHNSTYGYIGSKLVLVWFMGMRLSQTQITPRSSDTVGAQIPW